MERDDGFGCAALDKVEGNKAQNADRERGSGGGAGAPFSGPGDGEDKGHQCSGKYSRPGNIEVAGHGAGLQVRNGNQGKGQGCSAHRDVDPEDPLPAPVIGDGAAENGANQDRDGESCANDGHVARTFPLRGDPGNDGLGHQLQARGAHPLQDARGDKPCHVLGEAAGQGGRQEHHQRTEEDPAGSQDIT